MTLLGMGGAGMLSGCRAKPAALPKGAKVVVVGAGFAGISAAERLLEAGYDVIQIEAKSDMGGRVRTQMLGEYAADMGAGWLHDGYANGLRETAESLDLVLHKTNMNKGVVLKGSGESVPLDNVADVSEEIEWAVTGPYLWWQLRQSIGLHPTLPSADALAGEALFESGLRGCGVRELARTAYAADPADVSAGILFEGGDSEVLAGHTPLPSDDVIVQGGMLSLLRALVRRAKPAFEEPCLRITRTPQGVRVQTTKRMIDADAVVVTVSVGVLKSGSLEFSPGLPAKHISALDRLGFGSLEKLWLLCPETANRSDIQVLTFCDEGPFGFAVNLSAVTGAPLWVGLSAGSRVDRLNELGIDRAADSLYRQVQKALGAEISKPTATALSAWAEDPWVRGAYMYPTVNAEMNERAILQEPIEDRIFLAGEALSPTRFGLVDGAWADGQRAADLIIKGDKS
ncbi:MAG: FAD-dependent oxidoreductase [Phormidesmis sp.]